MNRAPQGSPAHRSAARAGRRRFAITLGLALAPLVAAGCGDDEPDSPEEAVRLLIGAARAGDRSAVYRRLGPATRARLEATAMSSRKMTGRLAMKPEDFLSVGWAPPAWDPVGMSTRHKDGASATVEVTSLSGDRHAVTLVREGDFWKIELPRR